MKNEKTNHDIVANFLGSIDSKLEKYAHVRNANMDAKLYGWNDKTLSAILTGIKNTYDEREE